MSTHDEKVNPGQQASRLEQVHRESHHDLPMIVTYFLILPTEVRIKIWNYASTVPRTIKLYIAFENLSEITINGNHKPPAFLQVNFESRKEAMKHCILC